ncbi:MAG: phospho-N-acetylmuramoyl-pentapeptide-transferase [Propionibacteriaceae bacterium]|nr:phospho-N-acetylmuramoyl-pentapeptide-transferase [Propionibacteriaceae bacterium]
MIQIVLAGCLSLLFTLIGTPLLIRFLIRKQFGQFIREDGPREHLTKRGTPTMGGAVILFAVVASYFFSHLLTWRALTASGLLLLGLTLGLGFIGFLDDWSKISKQRSLGLNARGKLIGQTLIAVAFAVLVLQFPDRNGVTPGSQFISFVRDLPWAHLPFILAVIWIVFLIAAWSNAVNLTDGLDGLAPGSVTLVFAAYALINIWQSNQNCATTISAGIRCYEVRDPVDLATVSVALAAACFGFLWWNANPAKIFLGDTGALALGGALAGLSVMTRTEVLLGILGFLFVMETLSVTMQVGYFKLTKGKRIFRMAPIHHHFELLGWAEVTVVIRFWIICGLCVALGLSIFYAESLVTL